MKCTILLHSSLVIININSVFLSMPGVEEDLYRMATPYIIMHLFL